MRLILTLVALSGVTLPAQTFVSPSHFTRAEGNTSSSLGIGVSTAPGRLLQVHEDVTGRSITAFAFRRDGQTSTVSYAAFSLQITLAMSTAQSTAAQPNATFEANHGADKRILLTNQFVLFPPVDYAGFAHPFDYRVPLTTPYQHSGTGPLCIDMQVTSRSTTASYSLDAATGQDSNPGGDVRPLGDGCRLSASSGPAWLVGSFSPNWPATMTILFSGSSLPPSRVAALTIGDSATQWGSIALPFELPGTAGAPSGPCTVYNNVLVTAPQFVDNSGGLSASLGFVPHPSMRGRDFFAQIVAPELAANSWGLVLTNGVQFHPAAPWTMVPVGLVELTGLGAVGNAMANTGQIIRLE